MRMQTTTLLTVLSVGFSLLGSPVLAQASELEIPPEDSIEPDNSFLECITYTKKSAEEREGFCRDIVSDAYRRECWRHTNDSARGWLAFCTVFATL